MLLQKKFSYYIYAIISCFLLFIATNVNSAPFFKTNAEATEVAKQLGYVKTNFLSKGQPVYKANSPKSSVIKG